MKHTIKTRTDFQPIEVTITIESIEELTELVAKLRVSRQELINGAYGNEIIKYDFFAAEKTYRLWEELDELLDDILQSYE